MFETGFTFLAGSGFLARSHVFPSLYYPWGKMRATPRLWFLTNKISLKQISISKQWQSVLCNSCKSGKKRILKKERLSKFAYWSKTCHVYFYQQSVKQTRGEYDWHKIDILTEDTCFIVDPFGKIIKTIGKFFVIAAFGFTFIELLLYYAAVHSFNYTSSFP